MDREGEEVGEDRGVVILLIPVTPVAEVGSGPEVGIGLPGVSVLGFIPGTSFLTVMGLVAGLNVKGVPLILPPPGLFPIHGLQLGVTVPLFPIAGVPPTGEPLRLIPGVVPGVSVPLLPNPGVPREPLRYEHGLSINP